MRTPMGTSDEMSASEIGPRGPPDIGDRNARRSCPPPPAMTEESQIPSTIAAAGAAGGQPGPAPRSQRPDRGAGSGCPDHQVESGGRKSEAGAEGNESPGSWRGRL